MSIAVDEVGWPRVVRGGGRCFWLSRWDFLTDSDTHTKHFTSREETKAYGRCPLLSKSGLPLTSVFHLVH